MREIGRPRADQRRRNMEKRHLTWEEVHKPNRSKSMMVLWTGSPMAWPDTFLTCSFRYCDRLMKWPLLVDCLLSSKAPPPPLASPAVLSAFLLGAAGRPSCETYDELIAF